MICSLKSLMPLFITRHMVYQSKTHLESGFNAQLISPSDASNGGHSGTMKRTGHSTVKQTGQRVHPGSVPQIGLKLLVPVRDFL